MSRHSAVRSARDAELEVPALAWPPPAANDPVVLSAEPFEGLLRPAPFTPLRAPRRWRLGTLVGMVAVAAAVAAIAAILTAGRFGGPSSRAPLTAAPRIAADSASPATNLSTKSSGASATELAEGIKALRSQMQAIQAPPPTAASQVAIASADEPGRGEQLVPGGNTVAPPPSPAALTPEAAIPKLSLSREDVGAMLDRAKRLIAVGDIAAARRLAEYAASSDDGDALFALAETFDPKQLARWHVRGVRADPEKARALYRRALSRGNTSAEARLAALP